MTVKRLGWLMGLILICSLTLNETPRGGKVDLISNIRDWAFKQKIWPHLSRDQDHTSLIAVRKVYQVEQAQLLLRVYLLIPCRNLCGTDKSCARQCQQLIKDWTGSGVDARLLIEGFDLKNERSLGRVALKTIAPVQLRYWSRQQKLIALTQAVSTQDHRLHLLQLVDPDQVDHFQEFSRSKGLTKFQKKVASKAGSNQRRSLSKDQLTLRYYDHLSLGPFTGFSEAQEGATKFVDLDNDQHIELVAPLKSLVHLTPLPLAVPTPYRLTEQGLHIDAELIRATSPPTSELRSWIVTQLAQAKQPTSSQIEKLGAFQLKTDASKTQLLTTIMQAKVIYIYAAQLCLKSKCDAGEKLVQFAYPQHEVVLRVWKQLREYISRSLHSSSSSSSSDQHPFSVLDRAPMPQGHP